MVAEHPVARAQLGRQLAQREAGEAVVGHVVDGRSEQPLPCVALRHQRSVPRGTSEVYHLVHAEARHRLDRRPPARELVFDFLDVMANHEPFNDHLMRDWELSGPARGVGSKARVHTRALGVRDVVDIEVVDAEPPARIVERNTAAKAGRTGQGTYTLEPLPDGGTRISFEYRWIVTPLLDRLTAPMARAFIRRNNETAMRRLAEQLAEGGVRSRP